MTKNRLIGFLVMIFVFVGAGAAQDKSLADAQNEIRTFKNSGSFSVTYIDRKDLTIAKVTLNIREDNPKSFQKKFKKFDLEMTSVYSGDRIDNRPVRQTLCINTQAKRFYFANENMLNLSVGEDQIDFSLPNRSTEVKGRKIKEFLCWDITRQIISDLADAPGIRFRMGSISIGLSPEKLISLKDYARLTRSSGKQ